MSANPVFIHLTTRATWPSMRLMLKLTMGLSLVTSLLVAVEQGSALDAILVAIRPIVYLLWLLTPFIAVLIALTTTRRYLRSDAYIELGQMSLTPRQILRGLILSTLYRLRLVLGLTLVVIPALVVYSVFASPGLARRDCYVFLAPDAYQALELQPDASIGNREQCSSPADPRLTLDALNWLLLAVACWGQTLFAVVSGVVVGLAWPRSRWTWLLGVAMLGASVLSVALMGPYLGRTVTCLVQSSRSCVIFGVWPPQDLLDAGLLATLPYALAVGSLWLTLRWTPQPV